MARNALLSLAILLTGLVGPFLMPLGASADGGLLDSVGEGVAEVTDTLDQPVKADAEAPVESTGGASGSVDQIITEANQPVSKSISGASDAVGQTISKASEPVGNAVNEPTKPLIESPSGSTQPVVQSISQAAQPLTESVNPVLEPVVEAAEPLLQTGAEVVAPVIDPLLESVEPVLEPVVELAEPLVEPVLELAQPVLEPVVELAEPLVEPIVELAQPVLEPILELTEPVLAPVVEPIEPVLAPIVELTEPGAPVPILELADPVLDPPVDYEQPGGGVSPVVPVPDLSLVDLIDPIVQDREPVLLIEAMTEEPGVSAEVPSDLPLLEAVTPAIPATQGGELEPLQSAPSILAEYRDWSSSIVRLSDGLRAFDSTNGGPGIHAPTPSVSVAPADSNQFILPRDDQSSYQMQDGSQLAEGGQSVRTPASSYVLLFDERANSSAGGGTRSDSPDSGLVVLAVALLAVGFLMLLTTIGASPRTWQFRPVTPPA